MRRSISIQPVAPLATKSVGKRESWFRWQRQYRGTKLAALLFLFLAVFFWWIPALYTLKATIPSLEALNRSEGVLSFTGSTRRTGYRMILRDDDGIKHIFSCKVSAIANGTCGGSEYVGKRAVVWWHSLDLHPLETIEHAVQIEVDGKLILTYEWSLWKLASAKTDDPRFAAGATIGLFILFLIILKIDRRRHESHND